MSGVGTRSDTSLFLSLKDLKKVERIVEGKDLEIFLKLFFFNLTFG